jgi:hypothetical protein
LLTKAGFFDQVQELIRHGILTVGPSQWRLRNF